MNMHSPELTRQHQEHAARQARLWGKKVKGIAPPKVEAPKRRLIEQDFHVINYREHQKRKMAEFGLSFSFSVVPSAEYQTYEANIVFDFNVAVKTMKEIAMEILSDFPGVTLDDIRGPRRTRHIVRPRQLAMYRIIRDRPDLSYPTVGKFFGGRDHTTVLHAVRKVEKLRVQA